MFCPNCGTQLADGAQFCPNCGKQMAQMARAQFDHGGAAEQPPEENGFKALGRTMGYMAKFWFLCAVGAIAICAVIGIIVWRVEYADGPKPFDGAKVKAEVNGDFRGKKVLVFHKKRRKGYRKLNGHRQDFTSLTISDILA